MFRLFFFVMFAPLFYGCSGFDTDPTSVVSVDPPEGSTLQPFEDITIKFTEVPENLHVRKQYSPGDRHLGSENNISLSGRIATIHMPFLYVQYNSNFTDIKHGLEIHLFWGHPDEKHTHVLKYSVGPDWTDGVLRVNVGYNYKSTWELYNKVKGGSIISKSLSTYIENISLSHSPRIIEVAIVKLLDIGFSQPVSLEEIRTRLSELGYHPLTLEEGLELRRQFIAQPSDDPLMNGFTTLLSEESMKLMPRCVLGDSDFGKIIGPCDDAEEIEEILGGTFQIVYNPQITGLGWQQTGRSLRIRWFYDDTLLDPYKLSNSDNVFTQALSKFACVISSTTLPEVPSNTAWWR